MTKSHDPNSSKDKVEEQSFFNPISKLMTKVVEHMEMVVKTTQDGILKAMARLHASQRRGVRPKYRYMDAPPVEHTVWKRGKDGVRVAEKVKVPTLYEIKIPRNSYSPDEVRKLGARYRDNRRIREAARASA